MINIEYNKDIEVTKSQFFNIKNNFGGIVAFRRTQDKYFIRLWLMRYKLELLRVLGKKKAL